MLVLIGPSASGKTESAKIMINRYPISRVVTCTTRAKRINEIDGFDYHFFSVEEFKKLDQQGFFIETAEYNNNLYGTPKNELEDDKFIILEPQGYKSLVDINPCPIVAIFLNTEESIRMSRMKERKDKQKDINRRITSDRIDFNIFNLKGLDLTIDTSNMSLSNVADRIYSEYIRLLQIKKENYNECSN
ncbi:MAG: guanylate kinase [Tenericutes bacterium]|nr:guanylate kinase [Mycoplasmatota bacterium]